MNRIIAAIVVAAVMSVCAAMQAIAGFEDGNSLYEKCFSPPAGVRESVCLGYVRGITDAMVGNAINGFAACPPQGSQGVTSQQIENVVKQYLASHPGERHYPAAGLVASALHNAFPCRR